MFVCFGQRLHYRIVKVYARKLEESKCSVLCRCELRTRHVTARTSRTAPRAYSAIIRPSCAFGGSVLASNMRSVTSSGSPSIPSSNHRIGKTMSGNLFVADTLKKPCGAHGGPAGQKHLLSGFFSTDAKTSSLGVNRYPGT
uniref:Uncharacterized protein n=1 Tax=Lutzomyia longipalpis TaxID=7200 RepID=A0A1B0CTF0_LUTLO